MTPRAPMMALLALLASSCAAQIHYDAQWDLPALPTKFARIEVVNARPPQQGGDDTRAVGIARGGYGNPMTFRQSDPDDLPRLIAEATTDALHAAGIDAKADAQNHLVARVLRFWMDGYVGYSAWVEIEYALVDPSGNELWKQQVSGREAGAVLSFGAASDLLSRALANLASEASVQFKEESFLGALR